MSNHYSESELLARIADLTAQVEQAAQPVARKVAECLSVLRPIVKNKFPQQQALEELASYTAPPKAAPLTEAQIESAAKVLSNCMHYVWDLMPDAGHEYMRKNAKTVIEAAIGTPATVEKG